VGHPPSGATRQPPCQAPARGSRSVSDGSGPAGRSRPRAAQAGRQADGKPRSELEALRRENELLRLNLEVVLEKVRAQAAELRALRAKPATTPLDASQSMRGRLRADFASYKDPVVTRPEPDAGQQAEAALKALREARDDAARRRAVDELDRALRRLREQLRRGQPAKRPAERLDPFLRKEEARGPRQVFGPGPPATPCQEADPRRGAAPSGGRQGRLERQRRPRAAHPTGHPHRPGPADEGWHEHGSRIALDAKATPKRRTYPGHPGLRTIRQRPGRRTSPA
jgi:hypothetical protein